MTAVTLQTRIAYVASEIDHASDPSETAVAIISGAAEWLARRYGPRIAAEILYSAADDQADAAPREWSL